MKITQQALNLYIVPGGPVLSTPLLIPDWLASTDQNGSLFMYFYKHGGGHPLLPSCCLMPWNRRGPLPLLWQSAWARRHPMLPTRPGRQPSHWERASSFPSHQAARGYQYHFVIIRLNRNSHHNILPGREGISPTMYAALATGGPQVGHPWPTRGPPVAHP